MIDKNNKHLILNPNVYDKFEGKLVITDKNVFGILVAIDGGFVVNNSSFETIRMLNGKEKNEVVDYPIILDNVIRLSSISNEIGNKFYENETVLKNSKLFSVRNNEGFKLSGDTDVCEYLLVQYYDGNLYIVDGSDSVAWDDTKTVDYLTTDIL